MTNALGTALRTHRESTRLGIRGAGELLGLSIGYLSQLETGKITWPNADVRRRLAQWLGISHLDLIVLTGEITPDEVTVTGQEGVVVPDPTDPRNELHTLIDRINWYEDGERARIVRALLNVMADDTHGY